MIAYAVPHNGAVILVNDADDVAAILADNWRKWLRAAGDNASGTYSVSVLVGTFTGALRDDDGYYGTFTSAGRDYTVVDSVIQSA